VIPALHGRSGPPRGRTVVGARTEMISYRRRHVSSRRLDFMARQWPARYDHAILCELVAPRSLQMCLFHALQVKSTFRAVAQWRKDGVSVMSVGRSWRVIPIARKICKTNAAPTCSCHYHIYQASIVHSYPSRFATHSLPRWNLWKHTHSLCSFDWYSFRSLQPIPQTYPIYNTVYRLL